LRREGLAREFVRLVQDERKNAGLDVSDRISLWWETADAELAEALSEYGPMIAGEVLAVNYAQGRPEDGAAGPEDGSAGRGDGAAGPGDGAAVTREHANAGLGLTFWLRRA
jgi:isoleucyl-tRNA synthetase